MSLSRRLWLLSPLVVLTLFFGACGWRSWHLSNDEEEVWIELPAYYLDRSGLEVQPFEAHQTTLLLQWDDLGLVPTPLPNSLLQRFQQRYPQFHLLTIKNPPTSIPEHKRKLGFGRVRFLSKFSAQCSVSIDDGSDASWDGMVVLTRSPLNLIDSRWHVTDSTERALVKF